MKFKLKELSIEYYRKINSFTLDNPHDMLIIGPNGVGKTSIMMALRDGLYGVPTANYQYGNEKNTKIEIKCEINQLPVHIIRTKGRAYANINGEEYNNIRDINKQINAMIPKHIFTTLVLNLTYFADLSPSEKKDVFDFIIGTHDLDKYTEAAKEILDETNEIIATTSGYLSSLENQLQNLNNQLNQKQEEYTNIIETHKELQKRMSDVEKEIANLQLQEKELSSQVYIEEDKVENKHDDKIAHIDQLIETYNNQLQLYQNQLKDITARSNQTLVEHNELQKTEKNISDLNTTIANLKAEIQQLTNTGLLIKQKYEKRINDIKKNSKKDILESEISNLEKQLSDNTLECPVCNKTTSKLVLHCKHCKSEIYDYEQDIKQQIQQKQNQLELFEKNTKETINKISQEMESKLQPYRDKINMLKEKIKEYTKQIENYSAYIEELKKTIHTKMQKIAEEINKEKQNIYKQIDDIKTKIQELQQEKELLLHDKNKQKQHLIELKSKLNEVQYKLKTKQFELEDIKEQLKNANTDAVKQVIDNIKKMINQIVTDKQTKEKEHEQHTKKKDKYTFWYKAFKKEIRTALLEDILPTINNDLLKLASDFNKIPNIRIYNNEFVVFGDETHFRDLSTGEKQLCRVLPNIVLSKYINSNIIFFDESYDGLDSDNIIKMSNIISNLKPATIIITHTKDIVNILSQFDVLEMGLS